MKKKRQGIRNTIRRSISSTLAAEWYTRIKYPGLYDAVGGFCMFVGHGRSGSTLVGALLNAHPNIVLSNELDALKHLPWARNRHQLFNLIFYQSRRQARMGSKGGGGYSYSVPGQWQGQHTVIRIIGDRKAGATALRLYLQPDQLENLERLVELPIKFISVVRNPFDTLATTFQKTDRDANQSADEHLNREIDLYFKRTEAISKLCENRGSQSIKFVRHESLLTNSRDILKDLCHFLGVDPNDGYLNDCSGIIRPTPNITRNQISWNDEQINDVTKRMARFPWLSGYSFSSDA